MLSNIGAVQAQSKEKQECNIEMETISIVLNCYRRTRWFAEQLNAIKNQSIKPIEILVWKNYSPNESISSELTKDLTVVDCNKNLGVWARFSLALNCKGKYICSNENTYNYNQNYLNVIFYVFHNAKTPLSMLG